MTVFLNSYATFDVVTDGDGDPQADLMSGAGAVLQSFTYVGMEHAMDGLPGELRRAPNEALPVLHGPKVRVGLSLTGVDVEWSYESYGTMRENLCQFFMRANPNDVWKAPEKFKGKPLFDLVQFSDMEGFLGPDSCARIAAALTSEAREKYAEWIARSYSVGNDGTSPTIAYHLRDFDRLSAIFHHAANGGMVILW